MFAAVVKRCIAREVCSAATRVQRAPVPTYGSFLQSLEQPPAALALQQCRTARRWHSSSPSNRPRQYEFEDIRELSSSPSNERVIIGWYSTAQSYDNTLKVDIDVREPSEYADGYIPGAINIPVKSQPDAIFLPEEEFEDRFGFSKPSEEKEIIFYCRSGVRSSAAAQLAQQQGYKNISEYRGSWLDWEKHGGPMNKP